MSFSTGGGEDGSAGERKVAGGEFTLSDPLRSFTETVRRVVLEPASFFRGIARSGDFVGPLIFTLVCALIGGTLSGIVSLFFGLVAGEPVTALAGLFGGIFLTPIFAVIGLFVVAGIVHLMVMLLVKPSNAGFEASYRVVAYLSVLYLVSWLSVIPILGILVGLASAVYVVVLEVIGVREVHSTATGRAVAVVLIPAGILLFLSLLLLALVGAAVFFSTQGGQF